MSIIRARLQAVGACRKTEGGKLVTDRTALLESGDPELEKLAQFGKVEKMVSTYLPVLERGTKEDLNVRYGLVESGRTSAAEPNIQNMPRQGGVRECFQAREGRVFVSADYATIELRCVAQIMLWWFGKSSLAAAFQDGRDPHMEVAMRLGGSEHRQLAKVANYGVFGGMGAPAFRAFAKSQGVVISDAQAREVVDAAYETWPELKLYMQRATHGAYVEGCIKHSVSHRIRGGVASLTVWANSAFQGLAADGAKAALYDAERSGLEPVAFLHDEILLEVPADVAEERASVLEKCMESAMKRYIPDVPVRAEAKILGKHWQK